MKYEICGEVFGTKDGLIKRIRSILHSYPNGYDLLGLDRDFMYQILMLHNSVEIKVSCGVESIFVKQNPVYKNNRGFWIRRIDGSETDFSFMECLSPKDKLGKFKNACRQAIRGEIVAFRILNLKPGMTCPITGCVLNESNVHVDHTPPNTFENIVQSFIKSKKIDVGNVKYSSSDNVIGSVFSDQSLSDIFVMYHNHMAKLRLVSQQANLSDIKKQGN